MSMTDAEINARMAEIATPIAKELYGEHFRISDTLLKMRGYYILEDGWRGKWVEWTPVSRWAQIGPLIEHFRMWIQPPNSEIGSHQGEVLHEWYADTNEGPVITGGSYAKTIQRAACIAIIAAHDQEPKQ